jgi:predicted membrane channel-forming protein YqfA (hemolysin III family)
MHDVGCYWIQPLLDFRVLHISVKRQSKTWIIEFELYFLSVLLQIEAELVHRKFRINCKNLPRNSNSHCYTSNQQLVTASYIYMFYLKVASDTANMTLLTHSVTAVAAVLVCLHQKQHSVNPFRINDHWSPDGGTFLTPQWSIRAVEACAVCGRQ